MGSGDARHVFQALSEHEPTGEESSLYQSDYALVLFPEMRFILCTWFGELCSCCSLTALPGPAWVLLNWICKELISSLY